MSTRAHSLFADAYFGISGLATISAWQEQLDWGLRILATLIAIAAGLASLRHHRKRRKAPPAID